MQLMALVEWIKDTPAPQTPEFVALQKAEAHAALQHLAAGVYRTIYSFPDKPGALIILEADSAEAAHQFLSGLPMVQAGYLGLDVRPLVPYKGFARITQS